MQSAGTVENGLKKKPPTATASRNPESKMTQTDERGTFFLF